MLAASAYADGVRLNPGDVLADVGSGQIRHFNSGGALLDTLNTTTGTSEGDGMCMDASSNLYATQGFSANTVSKFNVSGNLVAASFGSGYNAHPESCAIDSAGNLYVGQPDGSTNVLKFNSAGTMLASFAPATTGRGTDWIDLASDQCTLSYTSESNTIKRFNVCTNTQLPDFAAGLPGGTCYAHRILPDGGELVGCTSEVVRVNSSGVVTQQYPFPGASLIFAVTLDPDGTTFWTADYFAGDIWRVNIATGAIVGHFVTTPNRVLGGLTIVGELTAAVDQHITAAGGPVLHATVGHSATGTVATFKDPDTTATASQYKASINWGDGHTSTGSITGSAGSFTVKGTHTYAKAGSFTIKVTITDVDNSSNSATATTSAKVAATKGSASLHGIPAACVRGAFTARVTGKRISKVAFLLDGTQIASKTVHKGSNYSARVALSAGRHHLTVKVTFVKSASTKARTFRRTVSGCAVVVPVFTG
jgi:hypothetical protein